VEEGETALESDALRAAHLAELRLDERRRLLRAAESFVRFRERRRGACADRGMGEQTLGDAARLLMCRISTQELLDVRNGELDLLELAGVEHHEPRAHRERLVVVGRRLADQHLFEEHGGISIAAGEQVTLLQDAPIARLRGLHAKDLLVKPDRFRLLARYAIDELRGAPQDGDLLLLVVTLLGGAPIKVGKRQPILVRDEEALEGRERIGVPRGDTENAFEHVDGRFAVAEDVDEKRRCVHQDFGLYAGRRILELLRARELLVSERELRHEVVANSRLVQLLPKLGMALTFDELGHQRLEDEPLVLEARREDGFHPLESAADIRLRARVLRHRRFLESARARARWKLSVEDSGPFLKVYSDPWTR
jgi:hypothetical protein